MPEREFYKFEQTGDSSGGTYSEGTKCCTAKRAAAVLLIVALIAALVGVIVFYETRKDDDKESKTEGIHATTTQTPPEMAELMRRVDCFPDANSELVSVDEESCERRNCLFEDTGIAGVPPCYFAKEHGYRVVASRRTPLGFQLDLESKGAGPFGNDVDQIVFDVEMYGNDVLRFKFDDPHFSRYKVPLTLDLPTSAASNAKYDVKISDNETFAFQILRKSTGTVLWDTSVGGLTFSDQFLQISTKLPSKNLYGFGENLHRSFRHDFNHRIWPMFSRDQAPSHLETANLYGVQPYYTCIEDGGHSHGVLLLNSNAQDYSLAPLPMLTYRTIGGILDFYMFLGPEPENVVQQYTGAVGRPFMPPYWALGFQLCKYGYNSLDRLKAAVNRTRFYNIPHDVQYADIDHMDERKDFTLDQVNFGGLPDYFRELQADGMRTVIILDPALISNETSYEPYDNLTALDGAIKWPGDYSVPEEDRDSTNAMLSYVWPKGKTVFPDFFKDGTRDLWKKLIVKHHKTVPFDALWIDMNEPANFGTNEERPFNWPEKDEPYWSLKCPTSQYDDPPYKTYAGFLRDKNDPHTVSRLSEATICMIGRQGNEGEYRHYDVHSLYGWSETEPTLMGARAATNERSFVLTRSTFPGSGKYAGHWLGDNDSRWPDMKTSIIGMLEFNLFGIPYVGADICGYWYDSPAALCKRWMQLGAFYPFSRNHAQADAKEQDPGVYGPEVAEPARRALTTRYTMLPYLYTLLHKAHANGGTVVRPLFHEFTNDSQTYDIDTQFLWGPALMIVPILEEDQTEVKYYLPQGPWYDWYSGEVHQGPANMTRAVTEDSDIGLLVRGGHVLPLQTPALTTNSSRKNPMKLLVALDGSGQASGELFWDDGKSIDTYENGKYFHAHFQVEQSTLTMTILHNNLPEAASLFIDKIKITGSAQLKDIHTVIVDPPLKDDASVTVNQDQDYTLLNVSLPLNTPFSVMWSSESKETMSRIDCYPEALRGVDRMTQEKCEARHCVFDAASDSCYFTQEDYGYRVVMGPENTQAGFQVLLERKPKPGPFGGDVQFIMFTVERGGDSSLRFMFDDANSTERYKVPIKVSLPDWKPREPRYEVLITSQDPFAFQIKRRSNNAILWDTSVGGFTYADQFLQLSTKLPSRNVYGFGENIHHSFKHDLRNKQWPMFSRDQPVGWGSNLNHYGVHPFYMCVEDDGQAHGVLLLNSNAQDYSLAPLPMLTYRTIGGILDFYMFLGPEPENVVQQYTGAIGRPYMPPYWSLGFQLCRYGYNSIQNLKDAVTRTRDADIPHDVQYADIDHMDERKDFTVDAVNFPGLNDYFKSLQEGGMHTIIILDPCLISNVSGYEPYEKMKAVRGNIVWPYKDTTLPPHSTDETMSMLGYVWPKGKVVFPDFFKNETQEVWKELIVNHHKNMTFDGLWVDMNEPANFGTNEDRPWNWPEKDTPYWSLNCSVAGNTLEHPPYRTMAAFTHDSGDKMVMLSDKTLCMRARQGEAEKYRHYDVHSLYGWSQTEPTLQGLRQATGKRGIVISRSTFPSSGKHSGHWLGDNDSLWPDLRLSIIGMLEFNLFGIPYIGADVCGFFQNTNAELCKRWMQLGAFNTFFRNHNGIDNIPQDPGVFGKEVAEASRIAVETRYWLLPYLYTLFHYAHTRGDTVIRPLHHEFPMDTATYSIDRQFLWGPALLISPILEQGQTSLSMYLPQESHWYNYYTGEVMASAGFVTIPVTGDSQIPLHVRAGHILPLQAPANNTHYSRMKPFSLLVALQDSGNTGRGYTADGELFWDDGESIDTYENGDYFHARYRSEQDQLKVTVQHNAILGDDSLYIDTVHVFGVQTHVKVVYVDGVAHTNFSYSQDTKVMKIMDLSVPLRMDSVIEWREFRKPTSDEEKRVDCYPDIDSMSDADARPKCEQRGCIFNPVSENPRIPKCYIDNSRHGYTIVNKNSTDLLLQKKGTFSIFGRDARLVQVIIEQADDNVLHFKILDATTARYEVPVKLDLPHQATPSPQYDIEMPAVGSDFYIKVSRRGTATVLFDTSIGGLTIADQFLQIVARIPSENLHGFGEHRHFNLRHNFDYQTWPMFSRDNGVNWGDRANLYGVHPFYMCREQDGDTHGVLLLNSNAMEVTLQPGPAVNYRTVGGVLDFYMFLGPSPESVIQQYTQVIGRPYMPPYWALGFQLCHYGYNNLETMQGAVNRTRLAGIPHDVQYADIDHMDERRDFTIDQANFAGLPDYVKELQASGMRFITILDPALISNNTGYEPYDLGLADNVFIRWGAGAAVPPESSDTANSMLGWVWPKGKVVFPDFFLNRTKTYWKKLIVNYHNNNLTFDGLWIDMNEPANFGTNEEKPFNWPEDVKPYWSLKCNTDENTWDHPPYKPRSVYGMYLSDKTLCMIAEQGDGQYQHYNVHSLYGWSQTAPTLHGLQEATGKRGMVISRSTYPSSGQHAGHWLGDNDSAWPNLHDSIIGIIEFNLFGIPYIGADICGFFGDTTSEMCERWMQLGAFYTFSRNHNTLGARPQDPAIFGEQVADSSRRAMEVRYSLLPWLYTLFYTAHTAGGTVIRSMAHEFPADEGAWTVDTQFMWGSALLIAPVLTQNTVMKDVFFPEARWFDYYTGMENVERKRTITVSAPHDFIPLFLRGGHILPTQQPANNTVHSRLNSMGLLVVPDDSGVAEGSLFWDDGESIGTVEAGQYFLANFTLTTNKMEMSVAHKNMDIAGLDIDNVWVYGVISEPSDVRRNGTVHTTFHYSSYTKMLTIESLGLPLGADFDLSWS